MKRSHKGWQRVLKKIITHTCLKYFLAWPLLSRFDKLIIFLITLTFPKDFLTVITPWFKENFVLEAIFAKIALYFWSTVRREFKQRVDFDHLWHGLWRYVKGQLISKYLSGVFNFLQKTNENKSHSSEIEFIRSFFGGNVSLEKSFRFCLTFSISN